MSNVTFVSALINLYQDKRPEFLKNCFDNFEKLATIGLRLVVFVTEDYYQILKKFENEKTIFKIIKYEDLEGHKLASKEIPLTRNTEKDTKEFLIFINSKVSLIRNVIKEDISKTENYAWIDARIFHVIRNTERAIEYLRYVNTRKVFCEQICLPGCFCPPCEQVDDVCWYFCGGFFLGSCEQIEEMYQLYDKASLEMPKMTWEVNIMAKMALEGWKHQKWFSGFNDLIIQIPENNFIE